MVALRREEVRYPAVITVWHKATSLQLFQANHESLRSEWQVILPVGELSVLSRSRTAASRKNKVPVLARASLPVQALPHLEAAAPPRGSPTVTASSPVQMCHSCIAQRLPSFRGIRTELSYSQRAALLPRYCRGLFGSRQRSPSKISLSVSPWCEPHACMA